MSILAGQFPSAGLVSEVQQTRAIHLRKYVLPKHSTASSSQVGFTVFMNIAGALFAITAAVLYAIDLANASLIWMCDRSRNNGHHQDDRCRNVALFVQVGKLLDNVKHRGGRVFLAQVLAVDCPGM